MSLARGACRMVAATNGQRVVPVHIVSDTVCPWCFVGKRRLEAAIRNFRQRPEGKDVQFEVTWKPFQLNPQAPQDDPGRDKTEAYVEKFGAARVAAIVPHMTETFAGIGEKYSMGGKTGSTLNSHRLILWAHNRGGAKAQDALVEQLFKGYFTNEQYINDKAFLLSAAEAAGLPVDDAKALLDDPAALRDEVQQELKQARMQAISGVPNFTIAGEHVLSGAQDPATFESVFAAVV